MANETNDCAAEYDSLESRILRSLRADLGEVEFDALALEVHAFQGRWNRHYANFSATRPEPRTWREIPVVPQSAFKRYPLCVAPPELITKIFRTSGTTGEGYGEHLFLNTRLYDAAILAGWDRLRLPRATLLIFTPPPEEAPHSSLAHMMGVLARERGTPGTQFVLDHDGRLEIARFRAALERCFQADERVGLLGTALAFLSVCEQLNGRPLALRPGSFALETGGYKGSGRDIAKTTLYAKFGEHFGLEPNNVLNEYGMTELSSQCYTRGLGAPHEVPPWLRALVIDPETGSEVAVGEMGVLRIFDLANLGSVLAIETQDLAIRRERGFELIGRDPGALPRGCSRVADERMRAGE